MCVCAGESVWNGGMMKGRRDVGEEGGGRGKLGMPLSKHIVD